MENLFQTLAIIGECIIPPFGSEPTVLEHHSCRAGDSGFSTRRLAALFEALLLLLAEPAT